MDSKTRHQLAAVCHGQGRTAEAEAQLRLAVAECETFGPAWVGLGELWVKQERWLEVDRAAAALEQAGERDEADVLRSRTQLAKKEYAAARRTLTGVIERLPKALRPRVLLSHALLLDGTDSAEAERALRAILALDPGHGEATKNLDVLLRRRAAKPAANPATAAPATRFADTD